MLALTSSANASFATQGEIAAELARAQLDVETNWHAFHFDRANTGFNGLEDVLSPATVSGLAPNWSAATKGVLQTTPAIVGNIVYAAGSSPERRTYAYAYDAETGTLVWRQKQGFGDVNGITVTGTRVYVATLLEHRLFAYEPETGHSVWTFQATGAISAPTVSRDGQTLYCTVNSGLLYAIDAMSGSKKWSVPLGGSPIPQPPPLEGGVIYTSTTDGAEVRAFGSRAGQLLWANHIGGYLAGTSSVHDGMVFVGTGDRDGLYALDARTGDIVWYLAMPASVESTPAVAYGLVVVGAADGFLYAVDEKTGAVRWRADTGRYFTLGSPVVANGVVYAGTRDLLALDARTGRELWRARTGDLFTAPAIVNGVVYVGDVEGILRSYSLPGGPRSPGSPQVLAIRRDGTLKWARPATRAVNATPAILLDGRIAFVDEAGAISVINPDGSPSWRYETGTGSSPNGAPAGGRDGTVYAGIDQTVYAFHPDGSIRWTYTGDRGVGGPVGVAPDGTVYYASNGLAALDPDGQLLWHIPELLQLSPQPGWEQVAPPVESAGNCERHSPIVDVERVDASGPSGWVPREGGDSCGDDVRPHARHGSEL